MTNDQFKQMMYDFKNADEAIDIAISIMYSVCLSTGITGLTIPYTDVDVNGKRIKAKMKFDYRTGRIK